GSASRAAPWKTPPEKTSAWGWIERIEADLHFLTGQMGGSFIEALLKQECGIAPDQTVQAIEEQATDIGRGRQLTDPLNIALPTLKRRGIGGAGRRGGYGDRRFE